MITLPGVTGTPPEGALLRLKLTHGNVVEATVQGGRLREMGTPQNPKGQPLETGDIAAVLAPVRPTKIVCVGLNDRRHAEEMNKPLPDEPLIFMKPPSALTGAGAQIELPAMSDRVDYEGELALIIGARCKNVAAEKAHEVVMGVTCANDVTARDLQMKDVQFIRAKGFDTFCPLGPWIVARSLDTPFTLTTTVNGREVQRGTNEHLIHGLREIVAFISSVMTLEPGDVLLTGTYQGVGALSPGDDVSVTIDGVGTLTNTVVPAP